MDLVRGLRSLLEAFLMLLVSLLYSQHHLMQSKGSFIFSLVNNYMSRHLALLTTQ